MEFQAHCYSGCPFDLSKMPFSIAWQNALIKNALLKKGILKKDILSKDIGGHFWEGKRAFPPNRQKPNNDDYFSSMLICLPIYYFYYCTLLQGLLEASAFPALNPLVSKWVATGGWAEEGKLHGVNLLGTDPPTHNSNPPLKNPHFELSFRLNPSYDLR